jgi:hypothetical protein
MNPEPVLPLNTDTNSTDNRMRYPVMSFKSGFALVDNDRKLIREHAHQVREALFACTTEAQVECSVAFARYLSYAGLNSDNYWLFLRLVMTNNPWVIDELLHDREPRLLFSTIRPEQELIDAAFEAIYSRHPDEIYLPALEAVLGIIQNAYFDPDDGYRIRKFTIMDINTLGKFLQKDEGQDHPTNRLILDILDRMAHVGEYYGEPDKNVLSKQAFRVRYAYFDRTRDLVDAIPEPLLVRLNDRNGVQPDNDYAELAAKRKQRRRDSRGRFMKESPDASVSQASASPNPVLEGSTGTTGPEDRAPKPTAKTAPKATAKPTPETGGPGATKASGPRTSPSKGSSKKKTK